MTTQPGTGRPSLVGSWRKTVSPACADGYPDHLTFDTGTYRGQRGEGQGFITWDAGIYRLEGGSDLVLSTATDELVRYRVVVEGDRLHVEDPDGCRFTYTRASRPG